MFTHIYLRVNTSQPRLQYWLSWPVGDAVAPQNVPNSQAGGSQSTWSMFPLSFSFSLSSEDNFFDAQTGIADVHTETIQVKASIFQCSNWFIWFSRRFLPGTISLSGLSSDSRWSELNLSFITPAIRFEWKCPVCLLIHLPFHYVVGDTTALIQLKLGDIPNPNWAVCVQDLIWLTYKNK